MEAILDFSSDFDVRLFEVVVKTFYNGTGYEQENAERILARFQNHTNSWQHSLKILEDSTVPGATYLALQILERFVQNRHFITGMITKVTYTKAEMRQKWVFVNKLNLVLVQILKHEWPHNWSLFIPDLVQSSKTSLAICENNVAILKLLGEEIFDFSTDQLAQVKTDELKSSMCKEFSQIFQLCSEILQKETEVSLIRLTLETLLQFLCWIPLRYIFETSLIDMLLTRFLETPEFRNPALRCLAEIAAFNIDTEYDPKFVILFAMVMTTINRMIPPVTDIAEAYEYSQSNDQVFILNLSLFLTNFLSNHLRIVETSRSRDVLLNAHLYLIKITQVEEREILKICLEYWTHLVAGMYGEKGNAAEAVFREQLYADVLSSLRLVVIEKMVKPEEVLVFEGEMAVEQCDAAALHKSMRELLVYLTHLDVEDTDDILTTKLLEQMDSRDWSRNKLNVICWSIGSISGAMSEVAERQFLLVVIKNLLCLFEIKQGKDDKATIATNIMYIVGQYPRFLRAHWRFLKTVVHKLFEFMHEPHQGVQAMACNTLVKIAQKCKRQFIMQQEEENEPFVEYILLSLERIIADLPSRWVYSVYEAIGYIISAQTNKSIEKKQIAHLMETSNRAWDGLTAQAGNVDILDNINNLKAIINILKTNSTVCTSIGSPYLSQLGRIYLDMLGLYRACGEILNQAPLEAESSAAATPRDRFLRMIREEILKLLIIFIKQADDRDVVSDSLVPPLLESVLTDYANDSGVHEPKVLDLSCALIVFLEDRLNPQITIIMDSVFETTLRMIDKNFIDFPQHRDSFYKLLRAISLYCFNALSSLQTRQLKLFINSILWGMKHTLREISDLALTVCYEVIGKFSNQEITVAQGFYEDFLLQILRDTFWIIMDANHKNGFRLQSRLLAKIFELIQTGRVSTLLFDPAIAPNPNISNLEFVSNYCLDLLHNAFPELETHQTKALLTTLTQSWDDLPRFKSTLRDFLVQSREFLQNNSDFYLEEKEARTHPQKKLETAMRIPGMVGPDQLEDKDDVVF